MTTSVTVAAAENRITGDSQLRSNNFSAADRRSYGALFAMDHFLSRKRVDRLFPRWRQRVHGSMLESIRQNGEGRAVPLPRVRDLDRKTFMKEFVGKSHPVVFEGAAKDWECCRKWTFDWIKEKYGDDDVFLVDHAEVDRNSLGRESEHLTLADLIDGIDHGSTKYARFHPLLQRHPELRADINQDWLTAHLTNPRTSWARFYTLFLGGKGTDTAIHCAPNENIFVQVYGRKKWRLYPMDHMPIFDPPANRSVYKFTYYRTDEPDYERFPMIRHMDWYETELHAGDVLYNPPYYWHHVSNPVSSIGVGCRWSNIRTTLLASPLLATLELFNTDPNLIKGVFMAVKDFNSVLAQSRNSSLIRD